MLDNVSETEMSILEFLWKKDQILTFVIKFKVNVW